MINKIISHYKVLEKIGEGGMGEVYKAEDIRLKRVAALKFLPHSFSFDEEAKKRFIHEAQAASALDHPNICTIYEAGETDTGQLFISMAFYEGETLKEKISRVKLSFKEIKDYALQISEGLKEAHQRKIIHRDIKPANIFITRDGIVKILDFGLAKKNDLTRSNTDTATAGTTAYMSPEQARGEETDQRTDIWALGVLLYEMMSGRLPFRGEYDQAVIYSILNEDPDLTLLKPDHHNFHLKKIIEKCLCKEKSSRFNSADEISHLLQKPDQKKHSGYVKIIFLVFTVLLGGFFIWDFIRNLPSVVSKKEDLYRVGVLAFKGSQGRTDPSNFSEILQFLIVNKLTNIKELRIVDPFSLNGLVKNSYNPSVAGSPFAVNDILKSISISYYIDGTIVSSGDGYLINSHLIDPERNTILASKSIYAGDEEGLPDAANKLVSEFLSYFQIKLLPISEDKDVNPLFTQGTSNMGALKAFFIASQFNYKGNKDDEVKYLKRAIELDSAFISPRVWLIPTLAFAGNIQEANKHLEILEKLRIYASPFENVMIDWADAFLENDIEGQIKYLTLGLEYSPQNNIILFSLARLYFIKKNYSKALELLRHTMEMKWQYSAAYYLAGMSCCMLGSYDEAKDILENSLEIDPDPEIYALLSLIYGEENNHLKEEKNLSKYFTASEKAGQTAAYANFVIAEINFELKRIKNSLKYYKESVLLEPANSYYRLSFGNALCADKDTASAVSEYLSVLKLDQNNLNALLSLGMIYDAKNDAVNALEYYKSYLRIDSTDSNNKFLKERIQYLTKKQ